MPSSVIAGRIDRMYSGNPCHARPLTRPELPRCSTTRNMPTLKSTLVGRLSVPDAPPSSSCSFECKRWTHTPMRFGCWSMRFSGAASSDIWSRKNTILGMDCYSVIAFRESIYKPLARRINMSSHLRSASASSLREPGAILFLLFELSHAGVASQPNASVAELNSCVS
jgi:hypothetical protein